MDTRRLRVKHIAVFTVSLLLVGTFLSYFITPALSDARTKRELGLSDDAVVTDTARSPWIYVNEGGSARLYGDKMIGITQLCIPNAVNGVLLKKVLFAYDVPSEVETVVLPCTMDHTNSMKEFHDWKGLKTIVFAEGTTDLSECGITDMPALEEIYIPSSVTCIDGNFMQMEGVTVFFAGTEQAWLAMGENAETLAKAHTVVYETPLPDWVEK